MSQFSTISPMNPSFQVHEVESTSQEAHLVIEPLEQGYGHTVGNSLRRVLLTSLPGFAITTVRIDGVDHQYSSLEGMTQDIVDFILNLKQVRLRSLTGEPATLKLVAKGEKTVTASDIETDGTVEIVNPEVELATLAKGASLVVEMKAEAGLGYLLSTEKEVSVVGEIPVDALFSPVTTVNYKVEATRVGRRTDYDKVNLFVKTDGTITPLEAVKQAAKILSRQFTQVFEPVLPETEAPTESLSPEEAETQRLTVEELDLPTRIANALRKGGFKTVGDLAGAPKAVIAKVKNLGEKSVDVINEALEKKGVSLGE
jgi:DNA-directed RNA polymerase subunit alpha